MRKKKGVRRIRCHQQRQATAPQSARGQKTRPCVRERVSERMSACVCACVRSLNTHEATPHLTSVSSADVCATVDALSARIGSLQRSGKTTAVFGAVCLPANPCASRQTGKTTNGLAYTQTQTQDSHKQPQTPTGIHTRAHVVAGVGVHVHVTDRGGSEAGRARVEDAPAMAIAWAMYMFTSSMTSAHE